MRALIRSRGRSPIPPVLLAAVRGLARGLIPMLLIATLAGAGTAMATDSPDRPLAGDWVLDAEASDAGRRRLDRELRDVAGDLRPRRAGNPELVSGRIRPGQLDDELLREVRLPEDRVSLAVTDRAVSFRRDGGIPEVLPTDGRPTVVDADNPGVRMAAWESGDLWVERASNHGTRVIERWYATEAGLAADYEVRNGLFEDPITFTLHFLPATGSDGTAR